jgi:hypothetical protein
MIGYNRNEADKLRGDKVQDEIQTFPRYNQVSSRQPKWRDALTALGSVIPSKAADGADILMMPQHRDSAQHPSPGTV